MLAHDGGDRGLPDPARPAGPAAGRPRTIRSAGTSCRPWPRGRSAGAVASTSSTATRSTLEVHFRDSHLERRRRTRTSSTSTRRLPPSSPARSWCSSSEATVRACCPGPSARARWPAPAASWASRWRSCGPKVALRFTGTSTCTHLNDVAALPRRRHRPGRGPPIVSEPLEDLDGKVALVTGASRGVGAAIAEALAERGVRRRLRGPLDRRRAAAHARHARRHRRPHRGGRRPRRGRARPTSPRPPRSRRWSSAPWPSWAASTCW